MKQEIVCLEKDFGVVYKDIRQILDVARNTVYHVVNFSMVQAYWQIGKVIVEQEQQGKERAEYGKALIKELSQKLTKEYGKGFMERNIRNMRVFYLSFQKWHAVRAELTWTHYRLLLKVEGNDARNFYLNKSINSNWSTREFERQVNSLLFERIALSKDKKKVKELSSKGHILKKPEDIVKDPYVLEFLGIKENNEYVEKDLEGILINKLKEFLLELGKGFSFVARQKRITVDNDHYYLDLVFYNYILKCFVLVNLKVGKLTPQDIGQMDFYVRYFEKEEKYSEDNPTVGLILCSDKNETMIKYTLLSNGQSIFASKYKLYLPTEKELKKELMQERYVAEQEKKNKK